MNAKAAKSAKKTTVKPLLCGLRGLCVRRVLLTALSCGASPAFAQVAATPALFLEAVRDPGDPDVPSSARSLALGGIRFGSGRADDTVSSPASLMLGSNADVVLSAGPFLYSRDELIATPGQYPPRSPERARSASSRAVPFFAAIAARRQTWALAAFYDRSARFEHRFDTAKSNIFFTALQGSFVSEDGTGHGSVTQAISRLGGAAALGPSNRRVAVGVAIYAVRFDYDVAAHVHVDGTSRFFTDPVRSFTVEHDNRVTFLDWAPAFALSAMAKPVSRVVTSIRWERTPAFNATRKIVIADAGQTIHDDQPVRFHLPSTYAIGISATLASTVLATEFARTAFSTAFQPVLRTAGPDRCATPLIYCAGWGIANYEPADATTWHAGVEQTIAMGRGSLIARGGVAFQGAYTVARPTSDPLRNGGSIPAPPFLSAEEPPRDRSLFVTAGLGWAWRNHELAVGVARSQAHTRLLADFRTRF